jgi:hypothetical protein
MPPPPPVSRAPAPTVRPHPLPACPTPFQRFLPSTSPTVPPRLCPPRVPRPVAPHPHHAFFILQPAPSTPAPPHPAIAPAPPRKEPASPPPPRVLRPIAIPWGPDAGTLHGTCQAWWSPRGAQWRGEGPRDITVPILVVVGASVLRLGCRSWRLG